MILEIKKDLSFYFINIPMNLSQSSQKLGQTNNVEAMVRTTNFNSKIRFSSMWIIVVRDDLVEIDFCCFNLRRNSLFYCKKIKCTTEKNRTTLREERVGTTFKKNIQRKSLQDKLWFEIEK
jgi:hypothetical protein